MRAPADIVFKRFELTWINRPLLRKLREITATGSNNEIVVLEMIKKYGF